MMKKYDSIHDLVSDFDKIENHDFISDFDKIENNEAPIKFNKELIPLLDLLEKVNPCSQSYKVNHDCLLVTYFLKLNLFSFLGELSFKMNDRLCFMFGGFRQEDNERYDLYYNMLLKIVETGIDKKVGVIEFGQTAEESKLKIGCREEFKYLYVHHSNPVFNWFIQKMLPLFSYKPYQIKHHVFK